MDSYKPSSNTTDDKKEEKKKPRTWMILGIILASLCVLLVAAYFVLQYQFPNLLDNLREKTEAEELLQDGAETADGNADSENDTTEWEQMKLGNENETGVTPAISAQKESEGQKAKQTKPKESVLTAPRSYKELITTEEMKAGGSLTMLAQKHYGNKDLWVFIYEANLGRIKSPVNIAPGTLIRIPKLSEELMNTENPDTKVLIRQLSSQYSKRR